MVGKYQPLTLTPINFSLTEGTSIPAPPESPETPRPPTPGRGPLDSHPTPPATSGTSPVNGGKDSSEAPAELRKTTSSDGNSDTMSPTSPNGTKRPGSVRKFLGLHPMSSSDSLGSDRPGSPSNVANKQGLQRKKSSSWFGRRKSSFMMGSVTEGKENQTQQSHHNGVQHVSPLPASPPPSRPTVQKKKGPPPPALPALSSFGVSEETSSLGADDMFKNIK